MTFTDYDPQEFFDEMFARAGAPRAAAHALTQVIDALPPGEIERRQRSAERALMAMGITFNVYGDDEGTERIFPFDLIPRIVSAAEWRTIERGLKQRIRALNLFIDDIYHKRQILKSPTREEQMIAHAIEALGSADFDALSQPGAAVAFERLTNLLDILDGDLRGMSDAVTFHYFSHAEQRVS